MCENFKKEIGELFHKLRGNRTLFDVARGTGIQPGYISLIERGKVNISLDLLQKLCDFYRVGIKFIENGNESCDLHPQKP